MWESASMTKCITASIALLISAPSLGVCYFLSLTLYVCPSVCLFVTNIASSSLNLAIFGHQFSVTKSTKLFSLIFDLGSLPPKIYSPKFSSVVTESVIVCASTTFGLGAEIQSPTSLLLLLFVIVLLCCDAGWRAYDLKKPTGTVALPRVSDLDSVDCLSIRPNQMSNQQPNTFACVTCH